MEISGASGLWTVQPGWLNTASYGLPPVPAWEALQTSLADWCTGRTSWEHWGDSVSAARQGFARLIGVPVADVAVGYLNAWHLAPPAAGVVALVAGLALTWPPRRDTVSAEPA